MKVFVRRGDIFQAMIPMQESSHVIYGERPVLIISNNQYNHYSNVVNVIPITSQKKKPLPSHVQVVGFGLDRPSIILTEQIISLDQSYLIKKRGSLDFTTKMSEVEQCLRMQLGVA